MVRYFISAGHNPAKKEEQGVIANGMVESKMAEELSGIVVEKLQYAGYNAVFVPNDLSLAEEIAWINKKSKDTDDVALQIHFNSHPNTAVRGTETFYFRNQILAERFARNVSKSLGIPNNGYKPDNLSFVGELGFVRKTTCRSVLVEVCFLTNKDDVKALDYAKAADGFVNAIKEIESPMIIVEDKKETIKEKTPFFLLQILNAIRAFFSSKKLGSEKTERSLTQKANFITFLVSALALAGIYITESDINGFLVIVGAIATLISSAISYYGRWKVGDLDIFGNRI